MKKLMKLIGLMTGLGGLLFFSSHQLFAANFTVDSTSDVVDASPGDGVCATMAGPRGRCTLRAAIMEANALSGSDTITVPSGTYRLSIAPTSSNDDSSGDLNVTESVTITGDSGGGTVINANSIDRVLYISAGSASTVDLHYLTIKGGQVTNVHGGGIYHNEGTLNISHCTISGNQVTNNLDQDIYGGGIYNIDGTVNMDDSVVSNNRMEGTERVWGGGIANLGYSNPSFFNISNSTISSNLLTLGTEVDNFGAYGGGVFSDNEGGTANININNATIANNRIMGGSSFVGGAGIGLYSGSSLSIANSTIASNTIAGNSCSSCITGGVHVSYDVVVEIKNTILADNTASGTLGNCGGAESGISSLGYNLSDDATCFDGLTTGDQVGVDPLLNSLDDNGGPTKTMALQSGSPAIDAGNPSGCTDTSGATLTTDQRGSGYPRTADGNGDETAYCDIGAFERRDLPLSKQRDIVNPKN